MVIFVLSWLGWCDVSICVLLLIVFVCFFLIFFLVCVVLLLCRCVYVVEFVVFCYGLVVVWWLFD